ncbi:leucine rich repeat protein [Clostridium sp. MSTE9]|uniref:leucine-rich repeat domain-containing protein n=1 Tax=Clostridium sp. (strain MSTE9) TaxID=1105031 RepID=UPI00026F4166|nr:leucine-rich repeat domain-containing protein [Clostridium sp. MSTE9]EJF39691.1 leucine rich repeat protein [Clostridium sp. MSTE9]
MKKANKMLSLFLVLAVCISMFSGIPAFAANSDSDFVIQDGVLMKYNGTAKDVVIPDGVTEIGKEAFTEIRYNEYISAGESMYRGDPITSVYIPDSVERIGANAFNTCAELVKVRLPSDSVIIDTGAFDTCVRLSEINFPKISMTIGDNAFYWTALKKADFGSSSVSIGAGAFGGCSDLTSASGVNITSLGEKSFIICDSLSNVNFPNVTSLGKEAFEGCASLSDVNFPNVTSCGEGAFSKCTALKSVTLERATQYGEYAFGECGLLDLSIFHELKAIGPNMFGDLSTITTGKLAIPNTVTSIAEGAFTNNGSISHLIIPPSVKTIGKNAFPTRIYNNYIPYNPDRTEAETTKLLALKTTIYGVAGSAAQTYAKQQGNPFVAISAEQANAGKIPTGSFTIDTGIYTMAPGNIYQIGAKATGMNAVAVQCYSSVSGVASVTKLKNGNYQIKGIKPGTTYIMFDIIKGRTKVGHMSVRVDVKKGVKQSGQSKVQTVTWD